MAKTNLFTPTYSRCICIVGAAQGYFALFNTILLLKTTLMSVETVYSRATVKLVARTCKVQPKLSGIFTLFIISLDDRIVSQSRNLQCRSSRKYRSDSIFDTF